jgi:hypothetical protein
MKTRTSLALISALALGAATAFPAPAAADEGPFYLVLKGGAYFPTVSNAVSSVSGLSFDTGYTFELGGGVDFGAIGLQLSAGYLHTTTTSTSVTGWPLLALLRLRLPIFFIVPYLEGGVGLFISNADFNGYKPSGTTDFEGVVGAGVDLLFGPVIVGAEARYLWVSPTFTIPTGTTEVKLNGVTLTANLGWRF